MPQKSTKAINKDIVPLWKVQEFVKECFDDKLTHHDSGYKLLDRHMSIEIDLLSSSAIDLNVDLDQLPMMMHPHYQTPYSMKEAYETWAMRVAARHGA